MMMRAQTEVLFFMWVTLTEHKWVIFRGRRSLGPKSPSPSSCPLRDSGGGLSPDHQHWVHPRYAFFLSVKVLSRVFRGKFVAGLRLLYRSGELCLPGALKPPSQEKVFRSFLRSLFRQDWVVYAKPPFGGPSMCCNIWRATPTMWPFQTTDW